MCSYCGCEAEGVIAELMADHEEIALLAERIASALDAGDTGRAAGLAAEVAARFDVHARKEERGLFAQLILADVAGGSVGQLEGQHGELRAALRNADAVARPGELRAALDALCSHADEEDTDLFPAAMQLLPDQRWAAVAAAHREVDAPPEIVAPPEVAPAS